MRSLRRALVGLGLAGLAIGLLGALADRHQRPRRPNGGSSRRSRWWSAGRSSERALRLVAAAGEPHGALMTATGFAWFLQAMTGSNSPGALHAAGYAPQRPGLRAAHPHARRVPRRAAAPPAPSASSWRWCWFVVTVAQWAAVPFIDPHDFPDCNELPGQPAAVSDDNGALGSCCWACRRFLGGRGLAGVVVVLDPALPRRADPPSAARSGRCCAAGGLAMIATAVQLAVSAAGVDDAVDRALYIASLTVARDRPVRVPVRPAALAALARGRGQRARRASARRGERRELRDALADALGDPSLELAYWLPDRERYVDADGPARASCPGRGPGGPGRRVERDGEPRRRASCTTPRSPKSAS